MFIIATRRDEIALQQAHSPPAVERIQGYLAHKKQRSPRTLQYDSASVLGVVQGGVAVSYERGTPVWHI